GRHRACSHARGRRDRCANAGRNWCRHRGRARRLETDEASSRGRRRKGIRTRRGRIMSRKDTLAMILAAGQGTRLGGPKALLAWPAGGGNEFPLAIAHAAERLRAESSRVLVVTRGPLVATLLSFVIPGIDLVSSDAEDELGPAGSITAAASRLGE